LLVVIAFYVSSQTTYPIRGVYEGDTVSMFTDAQTREIAKAFVGREACTTMIEQYKSLLLLSDDMLANCEKRNDNHQLMQDNLNKIVENKDKEIRLYKRLLKMGKIKNYLFLGGGVVIGVVVKSLL